MTIARTPGRGADGVRLGVDSYSYHRLLGEIRPGESDPGDRWTTSDVIDEIVATGASVASLETCFLDTGRDLDVLTRARSSGLEIVMAWGHRDGLAYGRDPRAISDAAAWINRAHAIGAPLVRVVAASPWVPRAAGDVASTIEALTRLLEHAGEDVRLTLENHADLCADEIGVVLNALPDLSLCLDTANAVRVGDDPVAVARRFARRTTMVHLKDVRAERSDGLTGPRSCAFGDGDVDLDGVLGALEREARSTILCVELGHLGDGDVDERELVRRCLRWLRERSGRDRSAASPAQPGPAATT